MTALSLKPPYPIFTDTDGQPLENGYIYIGTENLNPQTNPVNVYIDEARTIQINQPIRTINGYLHSSGTPVKIYTDDDRVSIIVLNKNMVTVHSSPSELLERNAVYVSADDGAGGALWTSVQGFINKIISSAGSSVIGFIQAGIGAVLRSLQDKNRDFVSVMDFMSQAQIADVRGRTAAIDVTAAIQAAIDSVAGEITIRIPAGIYKITSTIYLKRNGVRLVGEGPGTTQIKYVNALGGIAFAGDSNTINSLNTYAKCALLDFEVLSSGAAGTDASIIVDLTSFSYSDFDIQAQTRRVGGRVYYGQGNAGTSPYFNRIVSTGLFGGVDLTQKAFEFVGGAWAGGSNGPNANMIGPITRAASFDSIFDIKAGQGNMFDNIGAESVGGTYIILGGNAASSTGTSSGSNTSFTLKDTTKTWGVNDYINGAVQITSGVGSGQIRRIATNTATQLNLVSPWGTIPDATSQYSVFELRADNNKFSNIRQEGLGTSTFIFAWPDSSSTEFCQTSVQSALAYLDDRSCSASNKFYGQSKTVINHTFVNPGASANVNATPRNSVFGGIKLSGQYVVDWVYVECQYFNHGDVANVTVDCGGTVTGGGSPTLGISVPDGESAGCAFPAGSRVQKDGQNSAMFINLQTGPAFSAGISVNVAIGVTLI